VASDGPKSNATATLLQFAGAAGATLLVLYLFGGLVMWVRFHAAGIPADQTVAALPRELLVVVGLRTLVVEIVVLGLLAAVATWIACRRGGRPSTGVFAAAGFVALLAVAAVIDVEVDSTRLGHRLTGGGVARVAGVAVAAVVVVGWFYGRWLDRRLGGTSWTSREALWLSLPMVIVSAATLGLAWEAAKGPIFPPVKVVRTDGAAPVEGFFVGESGSEILVGTGLCDAHEPRIESLVAVPRSDVAAVVMNRSVRLTDPGKREDAAKGSA
jgi:hypothetical protein